jgi:hypothetical protein
MRMMFPNEDKREVFMNEMNIRVQNHFLSFDVIQQL